MSASKLALACALGLSLLGAAQATAVADDDVVNVHLGPQTKTFYGEGDVKFVGINPIRFTAQLPAATVQTVQAPTPVGIPSGAAANGPRLSAVPDCQKDDFGQSLALASQRINALAQAVDTQIEAKRDALAAAPDTTSSSLASIAGQSSFTDAQSCVSALQLRTDGTADQRSAAASLATAYPFLATSSGTLTTRDFERAQSISCKGLLGGSSTSTLTLTLTPRTAPPGQTGNTEVSTVVVRCLGQVAVSGGFAFSSIPQRTFQALPVNNAGTPTAATVQEQSTSSVHAIPMAFVHVAPSPSCNAKESCTFISFGLGLTSSSSTTADNVNFALGLTQSFSRYAYFTGGLILGQETVPSPGYAPPAAIAVGATVPTTTRQRTGWFAGISFGARP